MNNRKIVITGGPGSGKTSIINELKHRGFECMDEISRQITSDAKKAGINQLFLSDPLLFSNKLLEGRIDQFLMAERNPNPWVFLDRGIPDILAYLDYTQIPFPKRFIDACITHKYDTIFILSPWQEIYVVDHERYENFEQSEVIHKNLVETYKSYGYELKDVPFSSVQERVEFILNILKD